MSLDPGHELSHYEVLELIGRGGMGEVYRAKDAKLDRDVAIKVLPEELAQDEERLRRFQREAKVLASLNHPNIAAIYELQLSGDTHYLVLELVPGETLAERIARGPVPVEEALAIANSIAKALENAHARGIVHRDLKPANIKITPDDDIKVLDFGLAKGLWNEGAEGDISTSISPTMTRDATRAGVLLGTAAYMSPEQAKGKQVDKRADIWAFGVVLYEMLTGARPFAGEDVSETLASVLTKEPDWGALPEATPPSTRQVLRMCLAKNAKERVRDIADVRLAMEGAFETPTAATFEHRARFGAIRASTAFVLALGGLVLGALLAGMATRTSPPPSRVERFVVTFPPDVELQPNFLVSTLALSRDGSKLAVRSGPSAPEGGRLVLREIGRLDAEVVEGPTDVLVPLFSPDGEWILYYDYGASALKRVSVRGEPPQTICSVDDTFRGASWASEETVILAAEGGLFQVSALGGEPELVSATDEDSGELGRSWPEILPGGRAVLYTATFATGQRVRAAVLESGEVVDIVPRGSQPRYLPTGYLVYHLDGSLWSVAFDAERLQVMGEPVPILEGVASSPVGVAQYSVADDGSLAYFSGTASTPGRRFLWVDRDGEETPLSLPPRSYNGPRLSPDGRQLAVIVIDDESNRSLWVFDVDSAAGIRLTHEGNASTVVWTPDGESVVFSWDDPPGGGYWDLHIARADGGEIRRLSTTPDIAEQPTSITSDGHSVISVQIHADGSSDVWALPIDGESDAHAILRGGGYRRGNASLSPDGRWLAYRSDQTGQMEIYLQPYPGPGITRPVSRGERGDMVIWAADGGELFYRRLTAVMAVSVDRDGTLGEPTELFDGDYYTVPGGVRQYHVAPDGRFLMMREGALEQTASRLVLVQNWFEELESRVPTDD